MSSLTNESFEFGTYTEITDFAFEVKPSYKNEGFVRFFICCDTWDFWFVRILEGYNEDYEQENSFILERNKIRKSFKGENLSLSKVKDIIQEDDGSNWDMQVSNDIDELIEMLDEGFGIINLKTVKTEDENDTIPNNQ